MWVGNIQDAWMSCLTAKALVIIIALDLLRTLQTDQAVMRRPEFLDRMQSSLSKSALCDPNMRDI